MGRKIPGKKHRGVKDPLEQLARKNASLQLNAPPSNPNEQEVPKSVLEIAKLKEMSKHVLIKKKKKKKTKKSLSIRNMTGCGPKLSGMKKVDKEFPSLVQWEGEDDEHFYQRVKEATDDIISETQIEEECKVKVKRSQDGNIQRVEMEPDEELAPKKKLKSSTFKKPLSKELTNEMQRKKHLNRRQRIKLKKKSSSGSEETEKDFSMFTDKVKFGEVVHMPPHLTSRPKGVTSTSNKPGQKNLLLKNMLNDPSWNQKPSRMQPVSMAMKKRQETQRIEAVTAYRMLKQARRNQR